MSHKTAVVLNGFELEGSFRTSKSIVRKKSRVLIVDDEKSNITVLWETLQSDYIVQAAKSGFQALEIIAESSAKQDKESSARQGPPPLPDLILLDIMMPEMDGYAVCKALKSRVDTCNIPIIFITQKTDDEDEAHGLQLGAVDYMTKPFNPAIVKARVQTHLELKAYSDQLEECVAERTKELQIKSKDLEETNIALSVLLNKKDEIQKEFKEKILRDIQGLVLPYLAKIKLQQKDSTQNTYIDIIQSNLNNLIESFAVNINSTGYNLTPTEIEIANLIREGKATKEIAKLMKLALKTIEWHRYNIRMKLGVQNQKVNLRTHLKSLQKN